MPNESLQDLLSSRAVWPRPSGRTLIGLPVRLRALQANPTPKKRAAREENVSPSVRFRILARDKFTCQYCGRSAPDVKLQVDHITPVAAGGTADPCVDCNGGKGVALIDGKGVPL